MRLSEIGWEIDFLKGLLQSQSLNLKGLKIYTEAASGPYLLCPILALMAGADQVTAQTRDSEFARSDKVIEQTYKIAQALGLENNLSIVNYRDYNALSSVDIVTNSNFVRPIDEDLIKALPENAVIPLMWETWEFDPEKFNIEACKQHNILALGTIEHKPPVDMLPYNGLLALKLFFKMEARLGPLIVVGGPAIFAQPMVLYLRKIGLTVTWFANTHLADGRLKDLPVYWQRNRKIITTMIVADHASNKSIIGSDGILDVDSFVDCNKDFKIGVVSGGVDIEKLQDRGISIYPDVIAKGGTMTFQMYELGCEPVLTLFGGGLKVGEVMARNRKSGLPVKESALRTIQQAPAMDFLPPYSWL